MNRSDLINNIAELYPKLGKKDVETLIKKIFQLMATNLVEGNRIELRGFGCFSLKSRSAGWVRNPRYGIAVASGERKVVYFRAGKELKLRVDR